MPLKLITSPHHAHRFKVQLYNLLHRLHGIDHVFTEHVLSANLNFGERSLEVRVLSSNDGMLEEFLDMLDKDKEWLLRVTLHDANTQPTVGYLLKEPTLMQHKLSRLDYGSREAVSHELVFGFISKEYERLSPSLKELEP